MTLRILVVDDEVLLGRAAARLLRQHTVTVVHSVADARNALTLGSFDLVVSDVMMPLATGVDLHRWVVANQPDLASRFIFTSGGTGDLEADYIASSGLPFVTKPDGFMTLSTVVQHRVLASLAIPELAIPVEPERV